MRVLQSVSFELEAGKTLAIVGPSGSGKTTLLNIIGSLEVPTQGTVYVEGLEVGKLAGRELEQFRSRKIGFVFQEHRLLPQMTALENVLVPTLAPGCHSNQGQGRELLNIMGVEDRADAFAWQMSGGQRQRVAVARAMINNARLLLCDEPTGNLDQETGRGVVKLFQNLAREHQVAVVMVTHNLALAGMLDRQFKLGVN